LPKRNNFIPTRRLFLSTGRAVSAADPQAGSLPVAKGPFLAWGLIIATVIPVIGGLLHSAGLADNLSLLLLGCPSTGSLKSACIDTPGNFMGKRSALKSPNERRLGKIGAVDRESIRSHRNEHILSSGLLRFTRCIVLRFFGGERLWRL
jgi:hypothetical protein